MCTKHQRAEVSVSQALLIETQRPATMKASPVRLTQLQHLGNASHQELSQCMDLCYAGIDSPRIRRCSFKLCQTSRRTTGRREQRASPSVERNHEGLVRLEDEREE